MRVLREDVICITIQAVTYRLQSEYNLCYNSRVAAVAQLPLYTDTAPRSACYSIIIYYVAWVCLAHNIVTKFTSVNISQE